VKIKDTLLAIHSDFHSGSSVALFPNKFMQFQHQNHTPTGKQKEIWLHFDKCTEYAKLNRKGKRLLVIHDGDAIDGNKYGNQSVTLNTVEQAEIHTELMDYFLRKTRFDHKADDRLFYVTGTESHTNDIENKIGKDLEAEKNGELYAFDHLELEINGRLLWFLHHGKGRGKGASEGNALRNWLRDVHIDCEKVGKRTPDLIVSGHVHTPTYANYVYRKGSSFRMIHGVICPSWQSKTRFAWKVAPVDLNEVGSTFIEIKADGEIRLPHFELLDTKANEVVRV
jgi:hypothetical protein